jgi:alpha-tubulin suppressor-like RCC1 family protein
VEDTYEQHTVLPLLVKFPGKKKIRSVSCGAAHTGAVTTSGELYMWGCANGGRLGLGDQVVSTVVVPTIVKDLQKRNIHVWQVSCGNNHSAICTEVTSETSKGCKTLHGGEVYVCGGAGPLGRPIFRWEVVKKLKDIAIRQVSCGFNHTAAVSSYGELYTWGRNSNGCTGHSPQVYRPRYHIVNFLPKFFFLVAIIYSRAQIVEIFACRALQFSTRQTL